MNWTYRLHFLLLRLDLLNVSSNKIGGALIRALMNLPSSPKERFPQQIARKMDPPKVRYPLNFDLIYN